MKLIGGEIAEFVENSVIINNSAACEVTFTRLADGRIVHVMTDGRNSVNRNTIARWSAFVLLHFTSRSNTEQAAA